MTNYVPLVQKILHVDPTAYKSARKIIRMIKLAGGLERSRHPPLDEAHILFAVADYALKVRICPTSFKFTVSPLNVKSRHPQPYGAIMLLLV